MIPPLSTTLRPDIGGINNAFWLVSDAGYEIDIVDLAAGFHDYGVLWTPTDLIFEIVGEPIAAITGVTGINQAADIRFATALADFAGKIPDKPAGHHMAIRALRVFAYQ